MLNSTANVPNSMPLNIDDTNILLFKVDKSSA